MSRFRNHILFLPYRQKSMIEVRIEFWEWLSLIFVRTRETTEGRSQTYKISKGSKDYG